MTKTLEAAPAAPEAQEITEASLRQMAEAYDNGTLGSETQADPLASAGDGEAANKVAEAKPAKAEPAAKSETVTKPEAAAEPAAKPSKEQREQERRERSWAKLEEQKAEFRKQQEALEQQKRELEARKPATSTEADSFESIAKQYELEGKDDLARIARERASSIREQEAKASQERAQKQFQQDWNRDYAELRDADPDLGDDTSDTYKRVDALLKSRPALASIPGGLKAAYEQVKLQQKAEAASGLEKTVEEYKQRISELEKRQALGGNYPSAPQGEKTFDQMSRGEQEQYLRRMSAQADGEA